MSKPISYYLSGSPPFPLESIERLQPADQINLGCNMLELACSKDIHPDRVIATMNAIAFAAKCSIETINDIPPDRMVRLAAAILMVATDDLELLQPKNLIV